MLKLVNLEWFLVWYYSDGHVYNTTHLFTPHATAVTWVLLCLLIPSSLGMLVKLGIHGIFTYIFAKFV